MGRVLAQELGCTFLDTDPLLELALRKSIARCFQEDGEPAFRAQETLVLENICRRISEGERCVVSTGGGIVLHPPNVELMRRSGLVVWLKASVETIRRRIETDPRTASSRPSLSSLGTASSEVEAVLEKRKPLYRAACDMEVSTDGVEVGLVVTRILSLPGLQGFRRDLESP